MWRVNAGFFMTVPPRTHSIPQDSASAQARSLHAHSGCMQPSNVCPRKRGLKAGKCGTKAVQLALGTNRGTQFTHARRGAPSAHATPGRPAKPAAGVAGRDRSASPSREHPAPAPRASRDGDFPRRRGLLLLVALARGSLCKVLLREGGARWGRGPIVRPGQRQSALGGRPPVPCLDASPRYRVVAARGSSSNSGGSGAAAVLDPRRCGPPPAAAAHGIVYDGDEKGAAGAPRNVLTGTQLLLRVVRARRVAVTGVPPGLRTSWHRCAPATASARPPPLFAAPACCWHHTPSSMWVWWQARGTRARCACEIHPPR